MNELAALFVRTGDVVMVIFNCNQLQMVTFFEVNVIVIVIGQLEYNVVGNCN